MSLIRVLRTAQQTLKRKIYADETLTDPIAPPTVEVTRLDGTVLHSGTATDEPGDGTFSFALPGGPTFPASVTWQLDTLRVTWTGTIGGAVLTLPPDYVEVVGGFLFGLAEVRAKRPPLDATKYPAEELAARRIEAEQDCEKICRTAMVPRFIRRQLTGNGRRDLLVPDQNPRVLRAVTVNGTAVGLSGATLNESGVLTRVGAVWPAGAPVIVEYEHGLDYPPERIRSMAMVHLRQMLNETNSGVPSNAISFTVQDGGVYRLATPGKDRTGIPEVDAVYERYGELAGVGGFA